MSARTAKGWRWAKGTMKVIGLVVVGWSYVAYRTKPTIQIAMGAVLLLIVGIVVAGIAFALGWLTAKAAIQDVVPANLQFEATPSSTGISPPHAESQKAKSKTFGAFATGVAVAVALFAIGQSGILSYLNLNLVRAPDDVASAKARELNKTLPRMVTEDQRWDSVIAYRGPVIVYTYTLVAIQPNPMDSETLARFRSQFPYSDCSRWDPVLLSNNISLRYRYLGRDGFPYADVIFDPSECAAPRAR